MQNSNNYFNTKNVSLQEREFMAWEFLFTLFAAVPKGTPKYSYLWLLSQDKTKKITVPFDVTNYDAKEEIAKQAIKFNDEGYHIFFGVNLTDRPMSKHERPHAEDITVQTAIVTDIDCKSDWHDTNKKDFPEVEQAEKFLPFKFSLLVNSGGGLHAYNMFESPLHLSTDEERKQAVSRNKDYIEMIRQNAGDFAGAVDGVHDLPRVLRLPGTYNLKNGRENAPLCKVIKQGLVYNNDKLRELIKPRPITPVKKPSYNTGSINQKNSTQEIFDSDKLKNNYPSTDNKPSEQERALAMLKTFSPAVLTYDEWLYIGMALKNNGNSCADWSDWSSQDDRFKIGECESKWSGFDRTDLTIATIHDTAKEYGNYSEKDFLRDWYRDNPEFDRKNYSRRADGRTTDKNFSADAPIDSLKIELQEVNKKLAAFEQEKSAAIEKLQSAISFDKNSVFADDILNAAAFCKLYDKKTFSDFKACIQNQIKSQGTAKFITEWSGEVRDRIADIKDRENSLLAEKNSINAQIVSEKFVAEHTELKNFIIPEGYSISADGVYKLSGEKSLLVSRIPAIIQSKRVSCEDKTFKMILSYLADNGKWQNIPATGEEIIFNSKKLVDLRAYGLPVTSVNANLFVEYLDAFKYTNERKLPMSLNVSRCGWYNFGDTDYFVDPRRKNIISDTEREIEITVDDSSTFAQSLKSVGSIDEWRKAYELAKQSPVARLIVAAAIAPPLLYLLGERNFMLYVYATTRAGKSTALNLAASAIGNEKIIRSFDGTKNGLAGAAADVNDFAFLLDEKQVADNRLKDQLSNLVYSLSNGVGRTKLNKDSSLKKLQDWRTVVIANGETELLDDNATGGAFTRLLQIRAKTILDSDTCAKIRSIIRDNYGLALPLVIDKIFENREFLKQKYDELSTALVRAYPQYLPDYLRYVAMIAMADCMLDVAIFGRDKYNAYGAATDFAENILSLIPTTDDISDFEREKNFVLGFIAANVAHFFGSDTYDNKHGKDIYGKFADDFVYISTAILKQACTSSHFDYKKLVADLIADKFFIPDDKIPKDRKSALDYVRIMICGVRNYCHRIPIKFVAGDDSAD